MSDEHSQEVHGVAVKPVPKPKRRRSAAVPLAVAAMLATGGLAACGSSSDADGSAVCVDQATQQRVNDDRCDDDHDGYHGGFGWYYIPIGHSYPSVGSKVSGGSTTKPSTGKFTKGGVPSKGGDSTIARGGFGGKSHGTGTGG